MEYQLLAIGIGDYPIELSPSEDESPCLQQSNPGWDFSQLF